MAVIVTVNNHNHPNGTIPSARWIDLDYFKTPPGIVKIVQFIIGIVLLHLYTPIWLSVVVYIAFIITHLWIWFYFFALQQKYQSSTPWPVVEFYYTAGATFAYGITSLITFFFTFFTAAAFGMLNTVAYAAGAFFLLKDWKEWKAQHAGGIPGQGP